MKTVKRYLADPATTSGVATITAIIDGERPVVRLEETWFHPQGGGQKPDRGTIGSANVIHVVHNEGDVDHIVDSISGLEVGTTYPFQLDAGWRSINAAYHTAGHLIACVAENRFPEIRAVQGHQWPGEARVEFAGDSFEDYSALQSALEEGVQKNIADKTPVRVIGDPYANRSIEIVGYTAIPCGGTHVSAINDIGEVKIESVKRKNGKIRVNYCLKV